MKKIKLGLVVATSLIMLAGCGNKQVFDISYNFNRATIKLQDDSVIDVEIKSWQDYDGEQIQIKAKDGTVYLVNSVNCTMYSE